MSYEKAIRAIKNGYFQMPFYEDMLKKVNLKFSEIVSDGDFLKIPFMQKDDLRNSSPYERTDTAPEDIYGIYSSNGTTGKKTFYVHSKKDHEMQAEFVREFYGNIGMEAGGLGAVLGPIGSAIMGHCMVWQFHAMNLGVTLCPEPSPNQIAELVTSLPVTEIATLPQVASFMAYDPKLKKIAADSNVKRLVLGGDFLSDARRKLLEETWQADVYNSFGMSEVFGPIGNECKRKDGFHYFNDKLLIEIISPETGLPVKEGEIGVGVYTTLWNKGFPLLRYWSGDLLRLNNEPCPCGSKHPRFYYYGRMVDCYKRRDGKWVSPREMEEITLPAGMLHCQMIIQDKTSGEFIYDKNEASVNNELLSELKELLGLTEIRAKSVLPDEMNLRGLKPKYFVEEQKE